ncbi:hypothetical protein BKA66DRAFT_462846 [Pyrenochaeta sp. MPI-SDFR-AT-0127]|nr:hypothetical protein BKA66DRAFT_462846 [Pyrenochaeta sp. MPI-SDFR-AT-0127]
MYITILLSALIATTLAAPRPQKVEQTTGKDPAWQPATGTTATCDKDTDKTVGFYVGPQLETVVNDACAAMLPRCAYQDRLPADTICIQPIDWPLNGPKSSTQSANVETKDGNKISGWKVKFAVTPGAQPEDSAGVFWTVQDCYGYFAYLLEEWEPKGCHRQEGFGVGSITVGDAVSLKGTVFEVTIVAEQ